MHIHKFFSAQIVDLSFEFIDIKVLLKRMVCYEIELGLANGNNNNGTGMLG